MTAKLDVQSIGIQEILNFHGLYPRSKNALCTVSRSGNRITRRYRPIPLSPWGRGWLDAVEPGEGSSCHPLRGCDDAQNPCVLDYRAIGTRANCFEILRNFHGADFPATLTRRAAHLPLTQPGFGEPCSRASERGTSTKANKCMPYYRFASSAICPSNRARSCFHVALSGESFVRREMISCS